MTTPAIVTVHGHSSATVEHAFATIAPIDLTLVFRGLGFLPSVVEVRDQTGAWDHVGATRTAVMSDRSTADELITTYVPPLEFGYRVGPMTGLIGKLIDHADGAWQFEPTETGTDITWTYAFMPKTGRGLAVRSCLPLWRRYAEQVLAACIERCDKPH
ncbi:MAG: hypothetical protein JWP10_1148 [Nocardioidaceae bacterium]|nr:hypothetical protein [Nocardioidaceae bacterium]